MIDILSQTTMLDDFSYIWRSGLLVFSRCMAFITMAPPTSHKSIPSMVKVTYAMFLTLLIMPSLEQPGKIPQGQEFIFLIVMNVCVGLLIGWLTILVIEIVRVAGEIMNMQMALQAANLFDPGSQSQTTIFGRFFDMFAMVIFISVGGVEKVVQGLYKSYETFPIITTQIELNMDKLLKASGDVITIGFLIVSPIIMILLVMDLVLGVMSRAAPQINAFQISFSIKPTIGVVFLLLILPALIPILIHICKDPLKFFY